MVDLNSKSASQISTCLVSARYVAATLSKVDIVAQAGQWPGNEIEQLCYK